MSINNTKSMRKTKDIFDDNFEVIYQEDYSDILRDDYEEDKNDDDYEDVLSSLSELDAEYENGTRRNRKRRKVPNLAPPTAKTVKTGGKVIFRLVNILLRTASLLLTAAITYILAVHFWKNHAAYGDVFRTFIEGNYILVSYAAVALFLVLFEFFTFLLILTRSKKSNHKERYLDTGRGMFSFVFICAGAWLAYMLNGLIPASPAPLQGVQGALLVYGTLRNTLTPLCIGGVISCLIRRFFIR